MMSPYLFHLVAEGLNVILNSSLEVGTFAGNDMGSSSLFRISYIQFADDILVILLVHIFLYEKKGTHFLN